MTRLLVVAAAGLVLGACDRTPRTPAADSASTPAAGGGGQPASSSALVAGVRILLVSAEPCVLRYELAGRERELPLKVSSPCAFHRETDGGIRVKKMSDGEALLVESSVADVQRPGDCITHIQGVLISSDSVRASEAVERIAMCTPFRWDDVMFIGLFAAKPR